MKFSLISILVFTPCAQMLAADPVVPVGKEETKSISKAVANTAAIAGAEFNRLRESKAEFKTAANVEAALHALAASAEPTNKALKKDDLAKHRKEVIALLLLQDGRLAGTPVLNQLVAEARVDTMGAKARRTAQSLASVFNAAQASGSAALEKVKTTDQAVDCIRAGVSGAGPFAKTMFKVTEDDATIKTALAYLAFDAQRGLIYEPTAVLENDAQQVPAPPASDAVAMVGEQLKIMAEMKAQRPAR